MAPDSSPADFDREVTAVGVCFVCALRGKQHALGDGLTCGDRLRPGPKLESHHLVPQRALKAPTSPLWGSPRLLEALCDPRNGIPVGQLHHDAIEDKRISLTGRELLGASPSPSDWTLDLEGFATDYGIYEWVGMRLCLEPPLWDWPA